MDAEEPAIYNWREEQVFNVLIKFWLYCAQTLMLWKIKIAVLCS
jgi:hypothetical protein